MKTPKKPIRVVLPPDAIDASPGWGERGVLSMRVKLNVTLEVREGRLSDVYKDIVRVHEGFRQVGGKTLREGSVCRVRCNRKAKYLVVRGNRRSSDDAIWVDERTRRSLDITTGKRYEFTLHRAGLWGELCWAWGATDVAYRVIARMAVLSVLLGLIALGLGVCAVVKP